MKEPRYDELIEDYAILDGIPAERIDLEIIATKKEINCTTMACGIGWLLLHPKWKARGFGIANVSQVDGEQYSDMYTPTRRRVTAFDFDEVAAEMYGIPVADARYLFNTADGNDPDCELYETDKDELLDRIGLYLKEKGAI